MTSYLFDDKHIQVTGDSSDLGFAPVKLRADMGAR